MIVSLVGGDSTWRRRIDPFEKSQGFSKIHRNVIQIFSKTLSFNCSETRHFSLLIFHLRRSKECHSTLLKMHLPYEFFYRNKFVLPSMNYLVLNIHTWVFGRYIKKDAKKYSSTNYSTRTVYLFRCIASKSEIEDHWGPRVHPMTCRGPPDYNGGRAPDNDTRRAYAHSRGASPLLSSFIVIYLLFFYSKITIKCHVFNDKLDHFINSD